MPPPSGTRFASVQDDRMRTTPSCQRSEPQPNTETFPPKPHVASVASIPSLSRNMGVHAIAESAAARQSTEESTGRSGPMPCHTSRSSPRRVDDRLRVAKWPSSVVLTAFAISEIALAVLPVAGNDEMLARHFAIKLEVAAHRSHDRGFGGEPHHAVRRRGAAGLG